VVAAVGFVVTAVVVVSPVGAAGDWHDNTRSHRIEVLVDPDSVNRSDTDVTFDISLAAAFADAGDGGAMFDPASLSVIEVDSGDNVIDADVPFQFVEGPGYSTVNAVGELTLLLAGSTSAERIFQVYFSNVGASGTYTPADHSGLGRVSIAQSVTISGRNVHRVTAGAVVWDYVTAGGGFMSIEANGVDWINWSTAAGSAGAFRGLPNLGHPTSLFHPGFDLVSTLVIAEGPLRVVLESVSNDGDWTTRWSFHRDRALMEVLDTPFGGDYWFQYEGTPGGAIDANDEIIRNDGTTHDALTGSFATDLADPEWMAAADTNSGWSLWMAQLSADSAVDSYKDLDDAMTVMAFGRLGSGTAQGLTGQRTFAVGFANADTHSTLEPIVDRAIQPFVVTVGSGESNPNVAATTTTVTATPTTTTPSATGGYWILTSSGRMLAFGDVSTHGDAATGGAVAAAATSSGNGYWIAHANGAVDVFGDAQHYGDPSGLALKAAIVGMAVTPSGGGYWLLGADGGIFSYGDADFHGSTGNLVLNKPVVDMATTPSGNGYWLVATDGGIFAFGDAAFMGSTGALTLNKPMISMAPGADGYWLVATDGGIFAFGNAPFHGSLPGVIAPSLLPVGRRIRAVDSGAGYLIMSTDGGLFAFGSANEIFAGSAAGMLQPGEVAVDLIVVE